MLSSRASRRQIKLKSNLLTRRRSRSTSHMRTPFPPDPFMSTSRCVLLGDNAPSLPVFGGNAVVMTTNAKASPRFKRTARRTSKKPAAPPVGSDCGCSGVRSDPGPLVRPGLSQNVIMSQNFFQIDALDLAPRLLGKRLRRDEVVLKITEVEAYRPNDSACHGRFGITARTAPVFGPGGHAYVYLCYGIHMMLNIVADKEGVGAAVLIRSCAPLSGLEIIQQRRGQITDKPVLLAGPGKVGQALGLSTSWSNHPLYIPGGLEILNGPEPENILVGPRVGIGYALPEHVSAPWRFAIADSPWISAPKNTLRPP